MSHFISLCYVVSLTRENQMATSGLRLNIFYIIYHFQHFFKLQNQLLTASCFVCVSIYLCVCMKQFGSHWTGFCEVLCCGFVLKPVKKIHMWLNFDKSYRYFPSWLFQLLMLPWLHLTVISNNKYWSLIIDTSLPDFSIWFTKLIIKDDKNCNHSLCYLLIICRNVKCIMCIDSEYT